MGDVPLYSDVNISHDFSALRAFFKSPHNQYLPVFVADTNHNSWGLRSFLLSPFFNIEIMARSNRQTVFHEVIPEISSSIPEGADPEEYLLRQLEEHDYPVKDEFLKQAWRQLGTTLKLAPEHGINIVFADSRKRELREERVAAIQTEKDTAENFVNVNWIALGNLHKQVFKARFSGPLDVLNKIAGRILTEHLDEELHRSEDDRIGKEIIETVDNNNYVAVFGSAHSTGGIKHQMDAPYGAALIELAYWSNSEEMVTKLYTGHDVGPTYGMVQNRIMYPHQVVPSSYTKEDFANFREGVKEKYEAFREI